MRWSIVVPMAVALCACERGDDNAERAARPAPSQPRPAVAARTAVFPEVEAAGVLRALSDAEIAVVRVAQDVSESEAVLAYARVVAADHRGITRLLDSTVAALGQTPLDNALSTELRTIGDSIAGALRTLPSGFNNTFIEEQVKAHTRALQLTDTALIPSARTPQLKNFFQAVRPTIAAHLQRAQQILTDRRRAAAARGEAWESGFRVRAPQPTEPSEAEAPVPEPRVIKPPQDTIRVDTMATAGRSSRQ